MKHNMWTSIKSLISDNKTKCIIIEDGMPKYVVLPFEEYQHLQKSEGEGIVKPERPVVEREIYTSPITLDDLPF